MEGARRDGADLRAPPLHVDAEMLVHLFMLEEERGWSLGGGGARGRGEGGRRGYAAGEGESTGWERGWP